MGILTMQRGGFREGDGGYETIPTFMGHFIYAQFFMNITETYIVIFLHEFSRLQDFQWYVVNPSWNVTRIHVVGVIIYNLGLDTHTTSSWRITTTTQHWYLPHECHWFPYSLPDPQNVRWNDMHMTSNHLSLSDTWIITSVWLGVDLGLMPWRCIRLDNVSLLNNQHKLMFFHFSWRGGERLMCSFQIFITNEYMITLAKSRWSLSKLVRYWCCIMYSSKTKQTWKHEYDE